MNDERSTIAGLRAQDCPGGGWTGMPAELEGRATVADCLARGVCGCIYGDAVQHIKRLKADRDLWQSRCVGAVWMIPDASTIAELRKATERAAKLIALEQKVDPREI